MPFGLKLAWKYFRSKRKGLVRFTSWIAFAGIAAGVASLILAHALSRGFSEEIRDKILDNSAHLSVAVKDGRRISNWQLVKQKLEGVEGVSSVFATTY